MRPQSQQHTPDTINTDFLRRYSRFILRSAHSARPSRALPIVHHVFSARAFPMPRLTELYHSRAKLQLKHAFRMSAAELDYASWNACKRNVDRWPSEMLDRFRLDVGALGDYQHIWFADQPTAAAWQRQHSSRMVFYGHQAVLMLA